MSDFSALRSMPLRLLRRARDLGVCCTCLVAGFAAGQERAPAGEPETARPTVGLVLSGGGARGGVHVGVLKALEELRVPIDYIAGTSIGAVIGGFYASGMPAARIEQVIKGIDWEGAFLEDTPRAFKSYRRKRDDDLFLVEQRTGLNNREFQLPLGIVQGQVIDLIVAESTLPATTISDFDELPIPFRAVAADIATGEAVVLAQGSFSAALRASMSVPAVIAPIEIDGRLLVDGGVAMNLPIEVARDMGADIIIAVDVSAPLLPREELDSVLDVTAQLTTLLTSYGVREQREKLRDRDILLVAELDREFGSTTFASMAETIPFGYALAMENAERLELLALGPVAYGDERNDRLSAMSTELPTVDFVRVRNNSTLADSVVERYLEDIEIGAPLDIDSVEEAINRVYGLGLYQNVRYSVVEDSGRSGLEFQLDERAWGPGYAQLGLQFNASEGQDVLFGVATSYLRTALNEKNGEWRATAILGDEPALHVNLHQPFGRAGRFFVAPSVNLDSKLFNVFQNGVRTAEARVTTAAAEIALGRELGTWGEARFGIRRISGKFDLEVGDLGGISEGSFSDGQYFARVSADTLDSVAFPRDGMFATLEWRSSNVGGLHADIDFDQLSLDAGFARSWGLYTMFSTLRYDTTLNGEAPITSHYRLGGLFDLSGLGPQALSGQHAARIGTSFFRRLNDLALAPAFAGVSLEYGNVWDSRSAISLDDGLFGGSVWVGVDTPVGPVYVAYGKAEEGDGAYYIVLGRIF
ncbi:MAG TPA: patatin-like phospholipase family protein [Gammaproteobacteria bacterium]